MKKIYVTYSNALYAQTRDFSASMALKRGGFDQAVVYSPSDIDNSFRKANAKVLSQKRGAGLWLWKPYFIFKALTEIADLGDIIFYGDAGSFFFQSCTNIINSMGEEDIWLSNIPLIERQFTTQYAFVLMDCDRDDFKNSCQIQANFICLRKSERSLKFIAEWLDYCCDYDIISGENESSIYPNYNNFKSHRYDQSVLSLLSKKWEIKPHLDPSQFGRYPQKYYVNGEHQDTGNIGEYKPCIILHRFKKVTLKVILSGLFYAYMPKSLLIKLKSL